MNNLFCEILLERHGESLGNLNGIVLGHTDLDLTELGYRQAEACAEALLNEKIDAIYSSDLLRAYHTALPHARRRGVRVVKSERFRELYLGEWENMTWDEIKEKYKKEYFEDWLLHFATFTSPSGESVMHLAERIYSALVDVARENPGGRILVATHAAAIRALFGKILGYTPEEASSLLRFPSNTSISRVMFDGVRLLPISYSDAPIVADKSKSCGG